MQSVYKLEQLLAGWYEKAPHLPKNGQKWLATNVWWIALVGVILSGLGILGLVILVLFSGALIASVGGYAGAAFAGFALIVILLSLVFWFVSLVLTIMAISPLKMMMKKGWTLIFMAVLVEVVSEVVKFVFDYNFFGLIWSLLYTAVGAYFLFEIRSFFVAAKSDRPSADAKKQA